MTEDQTTKSTRPSESDMLYYYQRLLPFKQIFRWLNHSPKPSKDFTMREFAYEFRLGAYQRYNSFESADEFKNSVVSANPTRFEVGAVYTVNPKERRNLPKSAMKPLQKELVFDIDLTDYDEIRTCCSKTDICKKCWKFIQVAAEIISTALREDFGYRNFIWVFSGRRGAHCWISDPRARVLDETKRKAVVDYLDLLSGKTQKLDRTQLGLRNLSHPHVERAFDITKRRFAEIILEDQDPWGTSSDSSENWDNVNTMLLFLPDPSVRQALLSRWKELNKRSSSLQKWNDLNTIPQKILKHQLQLAQLKDAQREIILYYMYPRLDVEVSKQMIHLLKSPFCIHPGTGNVCVPFDPARNLTDNMDDDAYGFNPMSAPNLNSLQDEIDTWEAKRVTRDNDNGEDSANSSTIQNSTRDYEKTSLKPYVDYFILYVSDMMKQELRVAEKRTQDALEF